MGITQGTTDYQVHSATHQDSQPFEQAEIILEEVCPARKEVNDEVDVARSRVEFACYR